MLGRLVHLLGQHMPTGMRRWLLLLRDMQVLFRLWTPLMPGPYALMKLMLPRVNLRSSILHRTFTLLVLTIVHPTPCVFSLQNTLSAP